MSAMTCITRADFDTSTLSSSYSALNGTGFSADIKILKLVNTSSVGIDISYDGVTAHDYVPAYSSAVIDLQANHDTDSSNAMGIYHARQGQIVYGKGTAGTGTFYIVGYR